MRVKFTVEVTLKKTGGGKFVSKEDVADAMLSDLTDANPQSVEVEDSTYEVEDWEVSYD